MYYLGQFSLSTDELSIINSISGHIDCFSFKAKRGNILVL